MRAARLALLGVLLAPACGESSGAEAGELEPLPTLEQERAAAAAEISIENADEELERLKRELEADR